LSITITDIGAAVSTTGSTIALSGVTVPAAAIVVLSQESTNFSSSSITDTAGNTYTKIFGPIFLNGGSSNGVAAWLCQTALALSSGTITYHRTGSASGSISACYVSGMTNPVIDTAVSQSTTGTNSGSGHPPYTLVSGSPAGAGEVFFAACAIGPSGNFLTLDTGNGWSHPPDNTGGGGGADTPCYGAQVNAGTGTVTSAPQQSGFFASYSFAGFVIAIKSTNNTKSKPFVQVF
jgi:hypothetical protein